MKKPLNERFQELAGIKPLSELEDFPTDKFERKKLHPTEVFTDEELDMVGGVLDDIFKKLNINTDYGRDDLQTYTQEDQNKVDALGDFIDGYFETLGGTY